eukprot:CAMPEP_0185595338 /NCGR_PEP_ID=MMETSP0434-20130131/78047_1 /TAXON_ID=626734 ORGANISM="Favella taraikaensis, Strain Fe Narragansett Bay" /NCGR_SAMPLE_ID=MMETSP0434 /ASSEMBLY_ACC=CAM_ASM_000379 /LENGTH=44 /DNA_ID= /DNA_START= /DNA_END= /DNA_ORIENTATION=
MSDSEEKYCRMCLKVLFEICEQALKADALAGGDSENKFEAKFLE